MLKGKETFVLFPSEEEKLQNVDVLAYSQCDVASEHTLHLAGSDEGCAHPAIVLHEISPVVLLGSLCCHGATSTLDLIVIHG